MNKIQREVRARLYAACKTPNALDIWLQGFLGLHVPRKSVCEGHCAPFDYLWKAYHEPGRDLVVWAPRGGGKTRLGAAVTLLDLIHKPGVQVRILGGSREQSKRMWEHLRSDIESKGRELFDARRMRADEIQLNNGSKAAILAQSQRAVRGLHVQKMRCDEVEMFDRGVWQAAQLVSKSAVCTAQIHKRAGKKKSSRRSVAKMHVNGTLEAISTHHKPWGLMREVIAKAQQGDTEVLKWCVFEVLERCPQSRPCESCDLLEDCQKIAKSKCNGFFSIDDAIHIKRRVSKEAWETEMLCKRPSIKGAVFPYFSLDVHVNAASGFAGQEPSDVQLTMDFGFNNPFVCLWIMSYPNGVVYVADEYVQEARMLHEHLAVIEARDWPRAKVIACDPAGNGRNDQTAESNISYLRRQGYTVRSRGSQIVDGIEKIRFALRPAAGPVTLFISPGCEKLIAAMQAYHYAEGGSEVPVKDGSDHCVDALRYFFVNRGGGVVTWRKY